jgi:hypothetical protein
VEIKGTNTRIALGLGVGCTISTELKKIRTGIERTLCLYCRDTPPKKGARVVRRSPMFAAIFILCVWRRKNSIYLRRPHLRVSPSFISLGPKAH